VATLEGRPGTLISSFLLLSSFPSSSSSLLPSKQPPVGFGVFVLYDLSFGERSVWNAVHSGGWVFKADEEAAKATTDFGANGFDGYVIDRDGLCQMQYDTTSNFVVFSMIVELEPQWLTVKAILL
jgi:hypothetical protein